MVPISITALSLAERVGGTEGMKYRGLYMPAPPRRSVSQGMFPWTRTEDMSPNEIRRSGRVPPEILSVNGNRKSAGKAGK